MKKKSNKYIVSIWSGSGYVLDEFIVGADSEEEALYNAIVLAEKDGRDYLFQEGNIDDLSDDEIDELYLYVDATMEGAHRPHYINIENLAIRKL